MNDQLNQINTTFKAAFNFVAGAASLGERILKTPLHLPGSRRTRGRAAVQEPGARAGIDNVKGVDELPKPGSVHIRCIDYNAERVESRDITDIDGFLEESRPDWCKVRWINVDTNHPYVVDQFRNTFGIHTLAAEDIVRTPQRPKVESYENHLFIVARMLRLDGEELISEQVSMFLFRGLLITFQEYSGDIWDPIRARIDRKGSRHRRNSTPYLLYSLLDATVDHCFPILEHYGDMLEEMEPMILQNPSPPMLTKLYAIKRELVLLRRIMWPLRELLDQLYRDEDGILTKVSRTYMRDVYDHAIQLVDIIETYREMTGGMTDLYMSSVSNRMNEVMKVLTIMASLFIPITFFAGVYGMNFEHIPELKWVYSYPVFWGLCICITIAMLYYFRRKGWLGNKST